MGASAMVAVRQQLGQAALGEYVLTVRELAGLTQRRLRDRLRDTFGLRKNVKDLWKYEKGVQVPPDHTRAALVQILGLSSAHLDELLLWPASGGEAFAELTARLRVDAIPSAAELEAWKEQARAYGGALARAWFASPERDALIHGARQLDSDQAREAVALITAMAERAPDAAREFLRYGRFRLHELDGQE